jgi:hypothetical protein
MADVNEVFNIIADSSTGAGEAAISRTEGEVAAAIAGLIGFAFKDSSGNVVLPQLDAQGRLPVTEDAAAGDCFNAHGELAAGSATLAKVTGAEIALTAGKEYHGISASGSCLRTSLFQVVHIDDEGGADTETVLEEFIVGPGQFSFQTSLDCLSLDTTGGTGTIVLTLKAKNFGSTPSALSSLRGTISTLERA